MNARLVFLAIVLILSGLTIILFLTDSGEEFYLIELNDQRENGKTLFASNCARCHGNAGEGVAIYPAIGNSKLTYQEIKKVITEGYKEMPPFKNFNDAELNQLIEYVQKL